MTRRGTRPGHAPGAGQQPAARRKLAVAAAGLLAVATAAGAGVLAWPESAEPQISVQSPADEVPSANLLANPVAAKKAGSPIADRYLVRLKDRKGLRTPRQINQAAQRLAGQVGGDVTYVYTAALHGFAVKMTAAQAETMAEKRAVAAVSQDVVVAGLGTVAQAAGPNAPAGQQASSPWHLDRIDQPNLPLSGTYDYDTGGAGANIYVLDTGVRTTHQEFEGRGKLGGPTPNDSADCAGHGTAVAGAAAGATYGVAKKATVHGIRVLGCDTAGPMTSGLQAIDWLTKNAPRPAVVNLSWGTSAQDELDNAIRTSIASGITYVIAAGNSNEDACSGSPARVKEAIVVGASDRNDDRAGYSDYGSCVDLFAPGSDITTSSWTGDNTFTTSSGTSLASPVVAGAVALYQSQHPSATPAQVSKALSDCAQQGILGNPRAGSPNLLLNARCDGIGLTSPGRQMTSVGQKVSLPALKVEGASGNVRFEASGLPKGIDIDPATGEISGAATSSALSTLATITATDGSASTFQSFQWDIVVGIGHIGGVGGDCVDSNQSGIEEGNKIQLHYCNQNWLATTDGVISFYHRDLSKCMSASGDRSEAGKLVVISSCDGGDDQVWKPTTVGATGELVNPATGQCLTAPKRGWDTALVLADCSGAEGQQWKLPSGMPDQAKISVPGNQVSVRGVEQSLRARATSTNTTTTFTYAATGLPNGLSIDARSGLISGTSTSHQAVGEVKVTATGSSGVTATAGFTWKVTDGHLSGPSGWCADDYYGKTDAGNPIVVWRCNDGESQLWTMGADGTLEVKGVCMTVSGGTEVVVGECAGATTWAQKGTAVVERASGLCLSAPALEYEKHLTVADCNGSTLQQWRLPTTEGTQPTPEPSATPTPDPDPTSAPEPTESPVPTPTAEPTTEPTDAPSPTPTSSGTPAPTGGGQGGVSGSIAHPSGSWCADVRDVVGLWDCNNTSPQKFTLREDGRLAQNTLCMTPAENNSRVAMLACDDADESQVWEQNADGTVLHSATELCLTASRFGYVQPFGLAECSGDSTQLWALPAA